jgi:regulator of cell morphogenesis and NO signaling
MARIEPEQTLAELVLEQPGRTRVFEELGLDYCCGGRSTLEETAARRDLDAKTLAAVIEAAERAFTADGDERDWRQATMGELCDHIVEVHHAFLRRELPRIGELAAKVADRHGDAVPALPELRDEFERLRRDLIEHIEREEDGVFLICQELEAGGEYTGPPDVGGALANHEAAHEDVGGALKGLRELGGGYDVERALCTSHRVLMESLRRLEADLHQHIHEENNILFPRLLERLGEPQPRAGA